MSKLVEIVQKCNKARSSGVKVVVDDADCSWPSTILGSVSEAASAASSVCWAEAGEE